MNRLQHLLDAHNDFEDATHLVDVEGLSSPRVCNLLNQMVAGLHDDEYYLEIGTWKGLTLCSAAYNNEDAKIVACDKFKFYGPYTGFGFLAKRALNKNVSRYAHTSADITFYHMTSRDLFDRGLVPDGVKVYFYDGDHSFEGTRHGVTAAAPHLCDESYVLMDDWNDPDIRRATREGIEEAGLTIAWERELEGENGDPSGWWNGLGVFILVK